MGAVCSCRTPSHDSAVDEEAYITHQLSLLKTQAEQSQPQTSASSSSGRQREQAPKNVQLINNAAVHRLQRYQREGGQALLTESILLFQLALTLRPPGNPRRSITLSNLAAAILLRYERDGGEQDVLEAITLHNEALSLRPLGHPDRSESLNNLAIAIKARYKRHRGEEDLLHATELHREALTLFPPGHPDRPVSLNNLAQAILMQYEREGGEPDLLEAIKLYEEALALSPTGHSNRSGYLSNLAAAALIRYERAGEVQDLWDAIKLYQEALDLRPADHPHRPASLNILAGAMLMRYEREGGEQVLLEALKLYREVLALLPPSNPHRPAALSNIACAMLTRYEREGSEQDLKSIIELHTEALTLVPLDHPNRSVYLNNLADSILTRYEREGRDEDLSGAIKLHREALSLRPTGHLNRPGSLGNLADAIVMRYGRDNGVEDLLESIELLREARALLPTSHPDRSTLLNKLANAIEEQSKRESGGQYLSDAIELHREALNLRPPGNPNRSGSLGNLANAIISRYKEEGKDQDLSEAIELHEQALTLRPSGHPNRPESLTNLADAIDMRYKRDGREEDLLLSLKLRRDALNVQPPSHPVRSRVLHNLANTISMSYKKGVGPQDLLIADEIIQLLRDAAAANTSPVPHRLQAALSWINAAVEHDPKSALNAYQSAFAHLGSALALGRSLQARHSSLLSGGTLSGPTKGLALEAALWALEGASAGPKLAVELLDQGRNALLTSVGQFRADLSDVRRLDPTLADEFQRTSRLLDVAILTGQEITERKSSHEDPTSRYKRISAEREAVIDKIRLLPGCAYFLLPVPYVKLQEAAAEGPVIVILVGKERSTAIIVTSNREPHTLELPDASEDALKTLYQKLEWALKPLPDPVRATRNMKKVLSDLWTMMVQPIMGELQEALRFPNGSRIWWYPTSWASLLPLHAAGLYKNGVLNAPDLYISSYTPTLRALIQSRSRKNSTSIRTTATLIVAQTQTDGEEELDCVDDEVRVAASLAPNASVLSEDQGTRRRVLEELRNYSWVHLACHGHPDLQDPFQSHFSLHDGPLSLQDIITNDLPFAEFAYLSACHSAAPDRTLPDEGLTLAGGMQFAGFRSAIGTLWQMADEDALLLARGFYRSLARRSEDGNRFDCTKTAEALHDAVKKMRAAKVPLFRWVNLVHYGI